MNYDLIIFDCDGTLVDSESISIKVIHEMYNEMGIIHSLEEIRDLFIGTQMKKIIDYAEQALGGVLPYDFEKVYRKKSNQLFRSELRCFDGVHELLEKIEVPICIASNGPREKMEVTLAVTGLNKYFIPENIFSAYDMNKWKPDPSIFYEILDRYKVLPSKALLIDDTISGVMGAINAGIDVIAYCPAKTDRQILDKKVPVFKTMKSIEKQIFAASIETL